CSNRARCLVTACRLIPRPPQSSLSVWPLFARSRSRSFRRLESASALNTLSIVPEKIICNYLVACQDLLRSLPRRIIFKGVVRAMKLGKEDGLLIVDAQQDFFPGGSLAVQEGDAILPVLHLWIEKISAAGGRLYATRDWHPRDHISFKTRGGPWPPHCVQDTPGAELHPRLHLPAHAMILNKGTHPDRDNYSGFEIPELAQAMRR